MVLLSRNSVIGPSPDTQCCFPYNAIKCVPCPLWVLDGSSLPPSHSFSRDLVPLPGHGVAECPACRLEPPCSGDRRRSSRSQTHELDLYLGARSKDWIYHDGIALALGALRLLFSEDSKGRLDERLAGRCSGHSRTLWGVPSSSQLLAPRTAPPAFTTLL